ncbi:hypothetical protein PR048_027401 [Dryococelus australis]|uniref:Uncharacterized protein n=1 Tax=Dryococelus australis TaxID=614101 RepID=A0ABQ9GFQ3_9NEOP|nr:hypothetical protein PR048_027401 [Dryococelus australis]
MDEGITDNAQAKWAKVSLIMPRRQMNNVSLIMAKRQMDRGCVAYRKRPVVEPVVGVLLEEVGVAIGVLQSCVHVVGDALPVRDGLWVGALHRGSLCRVEPPELGTCRHTRKSPITLPCPHRGNLPLWANYCRCQGPLAVMTSEVSGYSCCTFVEVNLAVAAPDHGGVQVVGYASEALGDGLGVLAVHLLADVPPVLVALEEVRLAVAVREGGIDVARQTLPTVRNGPRVAKRHTLWSQLPVAVACNKTTYPSVHTNKHAETNFNCGSVDKSEGRSYLYALDVVTVQLEESVVAAVEWSHERGPYVRVRESQGVSELMCCHLEQDWEGRGEVRTSVRLDAPGLAVVEVCVTTVDREVGVGESPTRTVEGITVAMLSLLEAHVNMHLALALLREGEVGDASPHVEGVAQLLVDVGLAEARRARVLGDAYYSLGCPRSFASGNHAGRCRWSVGFLGDLPFILSLRSGAASYSHRFTLFGSQDLDVKSCPNLFTCSLTDIPMAKLESGTALNDYVRSEKVPVSATPVVSYSFSAATALFRLFTRLACSPPTKPIRVQSPAGSLQILACGNNFGRCRCSAGFLGDLPFSPALSFRPCYILTSDHGVQPAGRLKHRPPRFLRAKIQERTRARNRTLRQRDCGDVGGVSLAAHQRSPSVDEGGWLDTHVRSARHGNNCDPVPPRVRGPHTTHGHGRAIAAGGREPRDTARAIRTKLITSLSTAALLHTALRDSTFSRQPVVRKRRMLGEEMAVGQMADLPNRRRLKHVRANVREESVWRVV